MEIFPEKWAAEKTPYANPEVTVTLHGTMSVVSTSCSMARESQGVGDARSFERGPRGEKPSKDEP